MNLLEEEMEQTYGAAETNTKMPISYDIYIPSKRKRPSKINVPKVFVSDELGDLSVINTDDEENEATTPLAAPTDAKLQSI